MLLTGNVYNLELNQEDFSESKAISEVGSCIENQNPLLAKKKATLTNASLLQKLPEKKKNSVKATFLSPDQLEALNGPERQFLIGPAGTGKTVILQAKALELLRDGKSVTVVPPAGIGWQYKKLFDDNGYTRYKIINSANKWTSTISTVISKCARIRLEHGQKNCLVRSLLFLMAALIYIFQTFVLPCLLVYRIMLSPFFHLVSGCTWVIIGGHTLIDDLFDDESLERDFFLIESLFEMPKVLMVLSRLFNPTRVVWVALDPSTKYGHDLTDGEALVNWVTKIYSTLNIYNSKSLYSVTVFRRVMRCSTARGIISVELMLKM